MMLGCSASLNPQLAATRESEVAKILQEANSILDYLVKKKMPLTAKIILPSEHNESPSSAENSAQENIHRQGICQLANSFFQLHLNSQAQEKNHLLFEDVYQQQAKILKDIKLFIRHLEVDKLHLLAPFESLLITINSLQNYSLFEPKNHFTAQEMQQWAKISCWLMLKNEEIKKDPKNKKYPLQLEAFNALIDNKIKPLAYVLFLSLAHCLVAPNNGSDLDILLAESCLEYARSFASKVIKGELDILSYLGLLCIEAILKYRQENFSEFFAFLTKMERMTIPYTAPALKVLCLAIEYYETHDPNPYLALKYANIALKLIAGIRTPVLRNLERNTATKIQESITRNQKLCQEAENTPLETLTKSITENFPALKLQALEARKLKIFVPCTTLLSLAETFFVDLPSSIQYAGSTTNPSGFYLVNTNLDVPNVIKAIQHVLLKLDKPQKATPLEASSCRQPISNPPASTYLESKAPKGKTLPTKGASTQKTKPSKEDKKAIKNKRKQALANTQARIRTLHASDFGFSLLEDPEVTPLYFSKVAQQKHNPMVLLYWKGVANLEHSVSEKFRSLLNPHIEGVTTVGPVGQPGFKIFKNKKDEVVIREKIRAPFRIEAQLEAEKEVGHKNKMRLYGLGKLIHK